MKIFYDINSKFSEFKCSDSDSKKLNFVLSDFKGDFVNFGVLKNFDKYQGYFVCDKDLKLYKSIDEFDFGDNTKFTSVKYNGFFVKRNFEKTIDGNTKEYYDKCYLSSNNCLVHTTTYDDWVNLDLDCREKDDFSTNNRNYYVYHEDRFVIVEYVKLRDDGSEDYRTFLAIGGHGFHTEFIEEWFLKNYEYSKERGTDPGVYVFRPLKFKSDKGMHVIFSSGFSKEEVINNLTNMLDNYNEIYAFNAKTSKTRVTKSFNFDKILNSEVDLAYRLSNNAIYSFCNEFGEDSKLHLGSYAGFFWFSDVWARDELASFNGLILNGEDLIVKKKIMTYINEIDSEGLIARIHKEGSLKSPDAVFWLSKRVLDFIKHLGNRVDEIFSKEELSLIFEKLHLTFNKLFDNFWDYDLNLLRVKNGDSWMDTIDVEFPMDVQVQLLGFIESLFELSRILKFTDSGQQLYVVRDFVTESLREKYFRGGYLYSEPKGDRVSSNIFLAYYFCPNLLSKSEWEEVFDNSIPLLQTSWGGMSSLSKKDNSFVEDYSGENNLSYHNGDSWFWINNMAAIVLDDLNSVKYLDVISGLIQSSTNDILKKGTIGFGSEISSSSEQKPEGCLAQLWSSAFFIEAIDKVFKRK